MTDDIATPVAHRSSSGGSSIRDELLEIQDHRNTEEKSVQWANNIRCLSIDATDNKTLNLGRKSRGSDYVAVSHAWVYSSIPEGSNGGSYAIRRHGCRPRMCKTRDEVLDRIVRYTTHHGVHQFWIDIECLDQQDHEEHQTAMDSMDLVYSYSARPLGLLSTTLRTQREVNLLQSLLSGDLTRTAPSAGCPRFQDWYDRKQAVEVLELLVHLSSDQWWHRRWIFQEEYRSSDKMLLMVRHCEGIKKRKEFGILDCELCFSPIQFRANATFFLLAYGRQKELEQQARCAQLLKVFGRYNILYHYSRSAKSKAMSTTILSGIARRNSKDAFDILPIVENTCDYPHRLASKVLSIGNFSLSMCILAMQILNGEIIKNKGESATALRQMNIVEYLDSIILDSFHPPVDSHHLSYIKRARLQDVTFSARGMCTKGHVWEISAEFSSSSFSHFVACVDGAGGGGLDWFERQRLYSLVGVLHDMGWLYRELAEELYDLLNRTEDARELDASSEQMCLMAKAVAEAVSNGGKITIAHLLGSIRPSAIFVGVARETHNFFTSWHHRTRSHGRVQDSWVSLGVDVNLKHARPELRTLQWVNGIAFFRQKEKTQVVFRWPTTWMNSC